jgi:predicted RNase H-like HicB family nuclease
LRISEKLTKLNPNLKESTMKLKVIIHKAEEGGYWAEVPALAGCATQGETMEEIKTNIKESIELYLDEDIPADKLEMEDQVIEIIV